MMRITETVKQLIIINVIFFIASQIVGEPAYRVLALNFPESPDFYFWQPLTHMFMHSGIMHILFNMWGLYMFGSSLEQFWGVKKFLFFYFSCGLGAALFSIGIDYITFYKGFSVLIDSGIASHEIRELLAKGAYDSNWGEFLTPQQLYHMVSSYQGISVGASGAIYGLMIAFALMFPNASMGLFLIPINIPAKYFVMGILTIDMISGLNGYAFIGTGDGVAHFAHLGGAAIGYIMMWYWNKNQFNNNRWN